MFVLFDAYGTLVELDDFYGRLQRGFAQHGANLSAEVVRAAGHAEIRHYIHNVLRARDFDSRRIVVRECAQVLGDAARKHGGAHDLNNEALVEILDDAVRFRLFPDTRDALEELHAQGVPMGVLSNWDYQLPQRFEEIDLSRYFHFVQSSSEIGYEKPAPQIFQRGLELAREVVPHLTPESCFYVGDHYEKDVVGAQNAGMKPIWVVREERDLPSGETPRDDKAMVVRSLREIVSLIGEKR